jgi:hypothetical protein
MRFNRFTFVFTALVAVGPALLLACTGDDNSLPLPPDAGSADAKAGDATTAKGDASSDASSDARKDSDGESDAKSDAATSEPDAGDASTSDAQPDVEIVPEAGVDATADAAPDAESVDAADDGG